MRASAVVAVDVDAAGRHRLCDLRSDPPLTLRPTGRAVGGAAVRVHLVGSAAGPLGGDDLRLDVRIGAGARLDVRSVAATMVHPGPSGAPSSLHTEVSVGRGGDLRWWPEPVIAVRGCDHRARTVVRLADGARLVWLEAGHLGRHGEAGGSLLQRLDVEVDGRPLLRSAVAAGPRWPASAGPAGVGPGCAALATLVVAGPDGDDLASRIAAEVAAGDGVRAAVCALDGPGHVLTMVAAGSAALRRALLALARVTSAVEIGSGAVDAAG